MIELFSNLKENPQFQQILEKLGELDNQIKEKFSSLKDDIEGNFTSLNDKIQEKIDEIGIAEKLKDFVNKLQQMDKEQIKQAIYALFEELKNADKEELLEKVKDLANFDEIVAQLKELFSKLNSQSIPQDNKFKELIEQLKITLQPLLTGLENELKPIIDYVEPKVKEKLEAAGLPTAYKDFVDNLEELKLLLEGLKNEQIENIKEKFNQLVLKIKTFDIAQLEAMLSNLQNSAPEQFKGLSDKVKADLELIKEYFDSLNLEEALDENKVKLLELLKNLKDNALNLFKNNEVLAPYYANLLSLIQKKQDLINNSGIKENYGEFIGNMEELKEVVKEFLNTKNTELSENIYELAEKLKTNIKELMGKLQELTDLDKLKNSYNQNLNQLNSTINNYIDQLSQSELTIEQLVDLIKTKIPNLSDIKAQQEEKIKEYLEKLEDYTKDNQLIQQLKIKIQQLDLKNKLTAKLENAGVLDSFEQHSESLKNLLDTLKSLIINEEQIEQIAYQFKDVKIKNVIEFVKKIPTLFNSDSLNELGNIDPQILMTKIQTELQNLNINPTEEQMALIQEFLTQLVPLAEKCVELIQNIQNKGISDAFQEYVASLNGLYDSFKTLSSEDIKKLQEAINSIQQKYKDFDINEKINELKNMPNLSQDMVDKLKNLIQANIDLDELKNKLKNIDPKQLSIDAKEKIQELLKNIKAKTNDLGLNPIIAPITEKLESFKEQIQQNEVVIAFEDYIQSLEKLCQSVEYITVGKIDMIKQAAYSLSEKLKNYKFDPLIDTLFNYKLLAAKLGEKIKDLQPKITPILDDVKEYLSKYDFKSMPEEQKQKVVELLGKLKQQIEEFKKSNPEFKKIQEELKLKIVNNELFKELNEQVLLANNLWNAYKQLYINCAESLKNKFESIKDKLNKIDGKDLILKLNSTLFDEKDNLLEYIENIGHKEINLGKINTILEENVKKLKDINPEKIEDMAEGLKIKFSNVIKDIISSITDLKDKISIDNLNNIDLASILQTIQNKDVLQPKLKEILEYFQEKTEGNEKLAEILEKIKIISEKGQNKLKEVNEDISEKLDEANVNLEKIKDYLSNLDSEDSQLLLKVNEFIKEKIKDYPQLQQILDSLNKVKDNVEDKINEVKETVNDKIKEANNTIFEKLEDSGILNKLQEYYKSLEDLKDKANDIKNDEKIQQFKEKILELKDKIANIDVKQFESQLRVFLNDDKNEWIATLLDIETIKENNEKIKEVFLKAKSSLEINGEQAKEALKNMKLKIESLKDNPNFSKLMEQLKKLNEAVMESSLIKPLKDNLDKFKEQIPVIKESLDGLKEKIDILSFDEIK